ncbi:hypothetical protein TNCV_1305771 [Trichonephila clavipes]|nr:hypothetical protein TNCV_1305771 [Trichonephila clavipes]
MTSFTLSNLHPSNGFLSSENKKKLSGARLVEECKCDNISKPHIALISELHFERLTATKWGATQDALSTVYKTYVRPVLEYGFEVVTLASTINLEKYNVVQNSVLRIITSGAKSTSIIVMQLQTASNLLIVVETSSLSNFGRESEE